MPETRTRSLSNVAEMRSRCQARLLAAGATAGPPRKHTLGCSGVGKRQGGRLGVSRAWSCRASGRTVRPPQQRLIFAGRGIPPAQFSTEGDVMAFVASNRGAIGYIAAATADRAGVKVIAVRP